MHRFSLLLMLFSVINVHAQIIPDTMVVVRQDSVIAEPVDTTRFRFLPGLGSIHQRVDSTSLLHNAQFDWTDAKYVGDLLWKIPGVYLHDLGEAGKPSTLTFYGVDLSGAPLLLDGRPLTDPLSGAVNLYDVPVENIEQLEVLDGLDALMYGGHGSAINLVTRQYNNNRPITKLRYLQGPFEYGLTDGFFAQNVSRGTNVMLALQRHVSDGRFTNSAYDSWNLRSQVRYNYSDRLNVSLSYFYQSADNGLNGGIDTASRSLFNEVSAIVHNEDANESTSRHDLTLTGIAQLLRDSVNTTQFSIYYTETERAYNDPDSVSLTNNSSLKGIRVTQRLTAGMFASLMGLDIQQSDFPSGGLSAVTEGQSVSALFAKTQLKLSDHIASLASIRVENTGSSTNNTSYGLGLKAAYGPLSLYGEFVSHKDSRQGITATIQLSLYSNSSISLTGFKYTSKTSYLVSPANIPPYTSPTNFEPAKGFRGLVLLRWSSLEGIGSWMFTESKLTPKWSGTGEIAYRDLVLKDVMELRTGIRFKYASEHRSLRFNSQYGLYDGFSTEQTGQTFTLDFFAVAHLGNAYLTISWENLLNKEYMIVARYPMPGRTFRLGFNWTFFD